MAIRMMHEAELHYGKGDFISVKMAEFDSSRKEKKAEGESTEQDEKNDVKAVKKRKARLMQAKKA